MKMSRRGSFLFALIFGVLLPLNGFAQGVFYGYDYNDKNIYTINPATQTRTLVGPTGLSSVELQGLAMSPGGILYATASTGDLYSVSTTTGAATFIGSTGRGDVEGLDFMGSTLVGITFSSTPTIFSIDTSTGATTDIVTNISPAFTGGYGPTAMAVANSTTVYISTFSSSSQANLYSADITTGITSFRGLMNVSVGQFAGLDFGSDGLLYGMNNSGGVWQIDPATAGVTLLGTIPGSPFWLDITVQPVPEPATWALLILGGGLLWLARRRGRKTA